MRNYRPLLIQDIEVAVGGVKVRRLRLNKHEPEAQKGRHAHEHAQLLMYLSGSGSQEIGANTYVSRPGTVIVVHPGDEHSFVRRNTRQPLCLVIDLDLAKSPWPCHSATQLTKSELSQVKSCVGRLFQLNSVGRRETALLVGAIVLEIVHLALKTAGWLRPVNRYGDERRLGTTKLVERAFQRYEGEGLTLEELSNKIGYQQDYLNRLVKQECGLTLGQLRAKLRVRKAQALLRQKNLAIHEIAEQIGILDPNYFSRWFRQQTGMTPKAWRTESRPLDPL